MEWLATVVKDLFADLAARVLAVVFWPRRHRAEQHYRPELRKFVLASVAEMNDALNKLQEEMTRRYRDPQNPGPPLKDRDALNRLYERGFYQAIRRRYGNVARLVKDEARLPDIEEALLEYINNYYADRAQLRYYMTLAGITADAALWQKWQAADERCFSALRKLKALPRPSSALDNLGDPPEAVNAPW